jgi:F-type H+-transporting ATPase subunit b
LENGLGINAWFLASQIVSFLILFFVLSKWVFPAIMKTLDKRTAVIKEGVDNAARAQQELAATKIQVAQMLDEARKEAAHTLAQATQAAEHVRAEIEQQAHNRANEIVQQAQVRIQQEVAQARAQLRSQVADLAILAAGQVVNASLDDAGHRRLVDDREHGRAEHHHADAGRAHPRSEVAGQAADHQLGPTDRHHHLTDVEGALLQRSPPGELAGRHPDGEGDDRAGG